MKLSSEMLKNLPYINIKKSQSLEVELVNTPIGALVHTTHQSTLLAIHYEPVFLV